jgi:BirA family biotin operon repressor/biotin-[acetyl-CoA-carboxylase] ligase
MEMERLDITRIEERLTTSFVGQALHYWEALPSTMDEAWRLARTGAPDGTVVLAEEQTAGRGRLERSWWAPAGSSLLLSVLLRPAWPARKSQRLTMVCSLAVCEAIAKVTGVRAEVKWPNDVLIEGRKVCGILTELDIRPVPGGEQLQTAVVGIGLNVNLDFEGAPPLMTPATSLMLAAGRRVSRLELLVELLSGIERRYEATREGRSYHREWAERMATLRREVQVSSATGTWPGVAVDVDVDGALLVRTADGSVRRVLAGDVTLRGEGA